MGEHSEKHIHFQDGDYGSDGCSDDDDAKAVEVCLTTYTYTYTYTYWNPIIQEWRD